MVLISLSLDSNEITEIPEDIKRLILLQELSAKCNRISVFPSVLFELSALSIVDLSFNMLTTIPVSVFRKFKSLKELNLANNSLISIPDEIVQATSLETLRVEGNLLKRLPELSLLKRLHTLIAFDNKIQTAPKNLPSTLETVDLSRNDLSTLSGSNICAISALQTLDLSSNSLTELPRFRTPKLEEFAIADNKLDSLSSLVDLPLLRVLDASRNALRVLPFSVGGLQELSEVYLRNNSIENVPASIGMCQKLRMLDISDNKIETLPEELGLISSLTNLKVRHNSLNFVPAKLSQLPHLQELDLYNNKRITNLPQEMTTNEDTPARAVLRHLSTLLSDSTLNRAVASKEHLVNTPDSSYRTPKTLSRQKVEKEEEEPTQKQEVQEKEENIVQDQNNNSGFSLPSWVVPAAAGAFVSLAIFWATGRFNQQQRRK